MLKPRDKKSSAIIMEFKVHKPKKEAALKETARAALQQIQDKQYDKLLIEEGYKKETIRHYGVAFHGKEILIEGC